MNQAIQDYRNTIAIADVALGRIGALGQPADPRSYALDSGLLSAATTPSAEALPFVSCRS